MVPRVYIMVSGTFIYSSCLVVGSQGANQGHSKTSERTCAEIKGIGGAADWCFGCAAAPKGAIHPIWFASAIDGIAAVLSRDVSGNKVSIFLTVHKGCRS